MNDDIAFLYLLLLMLVLAAVKILGIPLFLIFLTLRLCGVIAWSWWVVCIPAMVWGAVMLVEFVIWLTDR